MAGQGDVWVPVRASAKGLMADIVKEASGAGRQAADRLGSELEKGGQKAGQRAGKATADGLTSSTSAIKQASARLSAARDGEADAAGRVRVAEAALNDIRKTAAADSSKVARAEQQLTTAQAAQEQAAAAAERATADLAKVRDGGAATARTVIRAEDQLAKSKVAEVKAVGELKTATAALVEVRGKTNATARQVAEAEEKVASAQRKVAQSADQVRTKEALVASAHSEVAASARRAADSNDDIADGADRGAAGLSRLGESCRDTGANLGKYAIAVAGVGSAMELATQAMDFQSVTAKMNAQLGASGKLAEEYGRDVGTLYKAGVGDSMQDVADAVAAASAAFPTAGFEGEAALTKIAERASNLARIFDLDVSEATQTASQLIVNGLAKDSTEAMDLLTTAMQRVPAAMRGELPEILDEYGKHFQTFGLSGQEAMSLIVDMAPQGTIALDKTGDAIKELSIRATDGSKSTSAAFEAIGVDSGKMAAAIAQGGPKAGEAMRQIASGLLSVKDPAAQAQQAIALFGTPVEDLGVDKIPAFLQALSGGSNSMAGFQGAADQAGQTLNDTAQKKLTTFGREIQGSVIDKLGAAAGFLSEHKALMYALGGGLGAAVIAYGALQGAAALSAVAQGAHAAATGADTTALAANKLAMGAHAITTGVVSGATSVWTGIQWLLNTALLASPITWIVLGIAALIAIIVLIATKTTWFQTAWEAVWNVVKAVFSAAWNGIKAAFSAVWDFIVNNWKTIIMIITGPIGIAVGLVIRYWDKIKGAVAAVWNFVKAATMAVVNAVLAYWQAVIGFFIGLGQKIAAKFTELWDGIKNAAGAAKDWIVGKWDEFVNFVSGLPGRIGSALSGIWDGLKNGFRDAINFIIDGWNNFSLHFDFTIPVINKKVSFSIDTPNLPRLATGGVAGRRRDGRLFGPGTGTSDSILGVDASTGMPSALVSAGEFVVNAESTRKFLPLLQAINGAAGPRGTGVPRLAGGGLAAGTALEPWDGEGGLKPISVLVRRLIHQMWPEITDIGGYRASDPYPDHPSGQALDIMLNDVGLGDKVKAWLMDNKELFDLNYTIWQQKYEQADGTGNMMEDRGSPTQNHMDHIHSLFGQIGSPPDVDPGKVPEGVKWPEGMDPTPPPPDNSAVGTTPDTTPTVTPDTPGTPGTTTTPEKSGTTWGQIAGAAVTEQMDDAASFFGIKDTWMYDPSKIGVDVTGNKGDQKTVDPAKLRAAENKVKDKEAALEVAKAKADEVEKNPKATAAAKLAAKKRVEKAERDLEVAKAALATLKSATPSTPAAPSTGTPGTPGTPATPGDPAAPGVEAAKQPIKQVAEGTISMGDYGSGMDFYVKEAVIAAAERGFDAAGAAIGVATELVESGDPIQMYANAADPESMKYPHDAVGSDGSSSGPMQQQDNGAWGTAAQRMNARGAASMFFNALKKIDWQGMDPGAAAQAVQRSAFPDRYGEKMGRARELVKSAGIFDTGGVLKHGGLALNLSGEDELILPADLTKQLMSPTSTPLRRPAAVVAPDSSDSDRSGRGPLVGELHMSAVDVDDAVQKIMREMDRAAEADMLAGGRL